MNKSDHRILTTHVGSLVRPPELLLAAQALKEKPQEEKKYAELLRTKTSEVVKQQADVGLDVVNDGEWGKSSWANYVLDRLTGFEQRPNKLYEAVWLGRDRIRFAEFMKAEFPRGAKGIPGHTCTGPIQYKGYDSIRRNIRDLKAALDGANVLEGFLTAVAPASTGYDADNEFYGTEHDYVFAVAEALRQEYLEIHNAGLVLQVDDAVLANMYDHLSQDDPKRYYEWAELRVAALNHALRGIPQNRIRYHICFGSWHVPHMSDAPLEAIAHLMLKVHAGAYSIEAANVRHEHEWHVWEKVKLPQDKVLIPGVVTHHTTTVEHPRLIANRLIQFSNVVGRENVIAGTDCGFAQVEGIQRVHPQVMWAKLEALTEGARMATKELWGHRDL